MCPCWYAFQGVACILSSYGAFTEKGAVAAYAVAAPKL